MFTEKNYRLIALFIVLSSANMTVFAEGARRDDGGGNNSGIAKIQFVLKQLSAERDSLKAEVEALRQENSRLKEAKERLSGKVALIEGRVEQTIKNLDNKDAVIEKYKQNDTVLRDKIEKQREKMNETVVKFKEVISSLHQVEAERSQLTDNVIQLDKEVKSCAQDNLKLYETGLDILDKYQKKGVWSSLMQAEVVTGLKTVEMENNIEGYRHRLKDNRYISVVENGKGQ